MDPFTATASIASLADVAIRTTASLVRYAKDTKNASSEKKCLSEEAQNLSRTLERLRSRAGAANHDKWLSDHGDVVRQFEVAYDDLAQSLKIDPATGKRKEENRFKAFRTTSTWSFTKFEVYSLLERIGRLQDHANTLLADDQFVIVERIDQKQQEALDQKLKVSILNWLSPLQMSDVHQHTSQRAEKGSGKWFVASKKFLDWRTKDHRLLWCWGIPGAGKTVLASIIVNHLRRERSEELKSKVGIAVIYLRYNEPEQTLENVLASILKQFAQEHESVPTPLQELYELHRERNTPPSLDEVTSALSSTVETLEEVFLVVDALDECSEEVRWGLIERLKSLQPSLRLLITSRYLEAIEEELEGFEHDEIKANKADIELFIDAQIRKNRHLRKIVERSPSLRNDMKDAIVQTADEIFLLVSLHLTSLASAAALSIKHVRQKLRNLPTTLNETYQAAMQRIKDQESDHRDIAFKTLAWLTYAFRSLSLRELQHALAIEPGHVELDEELIMDGQSITALCAGLVIVDQGTNVVNLVHYTTKKYFEETRHTYFPNFHASITLSCATYLALDALKDANIWELVQRFPLACYAAQYMADHARQTPEESLEPSVLEVLCQLLSHPDKRRPLLSLLDGLALIQSGYYSSNQSAAQLKEEAEKYDAESEMRTLFETALDVDCSTKTPLGEKEDELEDVNDRARSLSTSTIADESVDTTTDSRYNETESGLWDTKLGATRIPEVTALHLAASMGLARVASMLLGATSNIDAVDETGKTALAVAMERGFEKAVEFLLNSVACVDLYHGHGRAVLLLVTERSWHKAGEIITGNAKSLLKNHAATYANDGVSFLLAAYEGEIDEVERLFEWANVSEDANNDIGAMALFLAVEREDLNMVQTLLNLGLNPNTKDNTGQASLHRATRRANEAMIKLLLERGAEIDCHDDDGRTPWSANVRMADKHVLKVLLDAGADPSTRGLQGVSELYTAAKDGETDCVKYMLECGTNASIKTNYDWTPLHWASADGHIECVKLLLAAGANPSVLSDQNVTPLDLALQANQAVSIELLTKAGGKEGKELGEWQGQWADAARSTQHQESIITQTEKKLTLVFDKPMNRAIVRGTAVGQYIYPFNTLGSEGEGLMYQISDVLETPTSSMSIRRSKNRATMFEYPLKKEDFDREDVIYDIHRVTLDYQEFDLQPKRKDLLPGSIRMHREWTGGWKAHHNHEDESKYLFRVTPDWSRTREEECRWMTEDGQLLARTGWEDKTPNIRFDHGNNRQMRDVLVSCWVTKLWFETVTG